MFFPSVQADTAYFEIYIHKQKYKEYSTVNIFLVSAGLSEMDALYMLLQHGLCEIPPSLTILSISSRALFLNPQYLNHTHFIFNKKKTTKNQPNLNSVSIMVKINGNLLEPEAFFLDVTSNHCKPHGIQTALPQNHHPMSCS